MFVKSILYIFTNKIKSDGNYPQNHKCRTYAYLVKMQIEFIIRSGSNAHIVLFTGFFLYYGDE